MGRLIDTDSLIGCAIIRPTSLEDIEHINACKERISHNDIPTAYDVEKVVEEITEKAERYCDSVSCEDNPRGLTYLCTDCEHYCLTKGIIEAVRKGGVNAI